MKFFYYRTRGGDIYRVQAEKRPSANTKPLGEAWDGHMQKLESAEWTIARDLTWGLLQRLMFLGAENVHEDAG